MVRAFIGVGSNIEPERNVRAAILRLARDTRLVGLSMVYRTEALSRPEQEPYLNCVAEVETEALPLEVKHAILRPIESSLGRRRTGDKYASRTIDLDLIVYDDLVLDEPEMRLPDPDILVRPFLAIPLFELAPGLVLPGFGLPIRDVAASLPRDGMTPLGPFAMRLREEAGCAKPEHFPSRPPVQDT